MKTMTATEASRHFSDLLDAVERGETITIVRGNHPVAEIGPAHRHGYLGGARSVGRRLILDTNILIAYERGTIDRSSLDDDELAIASVSVAEYRVGIEMADTADRAAERARALVAI